MYRICLVLFCVASASVAHWPTELPSGVERLPNGNTLIADAGVMRAGVAFEVDSLGRMVWAYVKNDVPFLHTARRTGSGTTLLTATYLDKVIEVDATGDSVWAFGGGLLEYPNDAFRLPNGNTLITDRDNNRVVEVDATGVVVWEYAALFHPHNGSRLPGGNTLVCDSNNDRVIEVDSAGNVVWQKADGLLWPRGAQRLPNGNTLITDSRHGRVIEVSSAGAVVWEYDGLTLPFNAVRLPSGNTLTSNAPVGSVHEVREVDSAGAVVWRYPWTVEAAVETLRVYNASSGCSLYVHIHRPEYAGPGRPVPGVVLVPGGNGAGRQYDSTGLADNIATDGFAVLHFDPDGRGLSGTFPEDYCGHVQQDGLLACCRELAARDYVDTTNLGILSESYGVTMASGMMARHGDSVAVKFLLDWEGPSDRSQTCADSGGHVPVPADSDEFWEEREAARFMTRARCAYLRVQTAVDHNPAITDNRHCIALIDSATDLSHGGSGMSPWTRVNDSTMNHVNAVYTVAEPPAWIPEDQEPHIGIRELIYLHELAALDVHPGLAARREVPCLTLLHALRSPVPVHEPVRIAGPAGMRLLIWNSSGRRVGACREAAPGRYVWEPAEAPTGCYWFGPASGSGAQPAKVILAR